MKNLHAIKTLSPSSLSSVPLWIVYYLLAARLLSLVERIQMTKVTIRWPPVVATAMLTSPSEGHGQTPGKRNVPWGLALTSNSVCIIGLVSSLSRVPAGCSKAKGKKKRMSLTSKLTLQSSYGWWGRPRARPTKARSQVKTQKQETF